MKRYLILFSWFYLPFTSFSQEVKNDIETFNFIAKPDSIIQKTSEGYIYITRDTTSKLFDWIVPSIDTEIYNYLIKRLKGNRNGGILKHSIGSFPRAWNSIYTYKGSYFLYAPSDWLYNSGFYISDSIIYITSSDPGDIYLINDVKTLSQGNKMFTIQNSSGEEKSIKIELLDKNFGIYSWSIYGTNNEIESISLMQNSELRNKLPMIVNDCGKQKCLFEFDFEK